MKNCCPLLAFRPGQRTGGEAISHSFSFTLALCVLKNEPCGVQIHAEGEGRAGSTRAQDGESLSGNS